jgi:hypothetical protein
MKSIRVFLFVGLLLALPAWVGSVSASESRWDNLLDVACRFTWYPKADLQNLLEEKGAEYGQPLSGYRDNLVARLTGRSDEVRQLEQGDFQPGSPWVDYYRLALSEFCLYLASDQMTHLDNAEVALNVFKEKHRQGDVAFWKHLFAAYRQMARKDSEAFTAAVFDLWEDVVLKQEVDDILMDADRSKVGFVKELPHLYENVAHLIIRRAIIEKEMGNLAPLGIVVLSIGEKLTLENGYQNLVKAIAERMDGAYSDNYNLNFAVAFLEGTANRNDFEAARTSEELIAKFNAARKFYRLAYFWADTSKGRAAVLARHMGFLTYVTRRMSDPDDTVATTRFFEKLPGVATGYLDKATELYDRLAEKPVQRGGFVAEGFYKRSDYLASMHRLWDATGKLSIMLADYYKSRRKPNDIDTLFPVESPLLKYCALFQRHARIDQEIVPNNAYFLAAYAARELADLYQQLSRYSTGVTADNLFFAYQMQAVELFPLDLTTVLQLAYQANQDGQVEKYFQYITPVADRLEQSKATRLWLANHQTEFNGIIDNVLDIVPAIMRDAYSHLNVIRESEGSEDGFYRKAVVLQRLVSGLGEEGSENPLDDVLAALGKADFSGNAPMVLVAEGTWPSDIRTETMNILQQEEGYPFTRFKNKLFGSLEGSGHIFLRELFYEVPYEDHQYVQLIRALRNPESMAK